MTVDATVVRYGNVEVGEGTVVQAFCLLGVAPRGREPGELALTIEAAGILRSHSVLYSGSTIGDRFESGHWVLVRENCVLGDD